MRNKASLLLLVNFVLITMFLFVQRYFFSAIAENYHNLAATDADYVDLSIMYGQTADNSLVMGIVILVLGICYILAKLKESQQSAAQVMPSMLEKIIYGVFAVFYLVVGTLLLKLYPANHDAAVSNLSISNYKVGTDKETVYRELSELLFQQSDFQLVFGLVLIVIGAFATILFFQSLKDRIAKGIQIVKNKVSKANKVNTDEGNTTEVKTNMVKTDEPKAQK
jgi:ascorbate-specific PTS system EIIC-type component UlaA